MAESKNKLQCLVVTPEMTVLDQAVDFVAVPLYDGELGILPGRAPLVARLGYGELRAQVGSTTLHFYIDGGFLQVRHNVVTVLTARAIAAENIDPAVSQAALNSANEQVATTPEASEARTISIARARAQLRIARHAKAV